MHKPFMLKFSRKFMRGPFLATRGASLRTRTTKIIVLQSVPALVTKRSSLLRLGLKSVTGTAYEGVPNVTLCINP